MKMNRLFTKEEEQFIINNYKGKLATELTKMLNDTFNKNYTCNQIRRYKIKNKLASGVCTRFYKGQIPHNLKQEKDEFIDERGYHRIKINGKWEMEARYLYEKEHGKIPSDWTVVFLDGNKNNLEITNLMAIHRRDKLVCKNKKMFSQNPEATKVGILTAQLSNKLYDIRKEEKKYDTNNNKK